tara:strand:- start:33 stop:395 length:363 start_codon:yes stop_codon:yes gene_type:complete
MKNRWIYHLSRKKDLDASLELDFYIPSAGDKNDGFVHFSTAKQLAVSAKKHRNGEKDIFLLEVDTHLIVDDLRWESARNNECFPHLYGPFFKKYVTRLTAISIDDTGNHLLPKLKDEPHE